ncbi:unnamed protein product, partial [marine sediment metagenome]
MVQKAEERGVGTGIVVGGIGGAALAATIAMLLAARPAAAAPPEEKLNYLIEVLTTLVPVLAELSERQAALIELIEQWLAAQGVPGIPGVEVTVLTPWAAKEPEEIFSQAILSAGDFYSDKMVNWTKGKRILFKAESSLNEAVNIQLIGNITDSKELATDIGLALPCTANGNISVGPAWDDWHPYVGVKITVGVAPAAGILTIWA